MKESTKSKWDTIIKLAIAILSAIAGALGASACAWRMAQLIIDN